MRKALVYKTSCIQLQQPKSATQVKLHKDAKPGSKKNLLLTEVIIDSEIVDDFEYR